MNFLKESPAPFSKLKRPFDPAILPQRKNWLNFSR